jgi:hypothetical protein
MVFMVFVLSVVCLTTTQQRLCSFTLMDYTLAWMGVSFFSAYFLREILVKAGIKNMLASRWNIRLALAKMLRD